MTSGHGKWRAMFTTGIGRHDQKSGHHGGGDRLFRANRVTQGVWGASLLVAALLTDPSLGGILGGWLVSTGQAGMLSAVTSAQRSQSRTPPLMSAAPGDPSPLPGGASPSLELSLADSVRLGLAGNFALRAEQLTPRIRAEDIPREEAAFDTVGFAKATAGESSLPSTSLALPVDTLETSNQSIAGGIRRRFPTGTGHEVATVLQRSTDTTPLQRFNPALGPALSLSLTQNLLKNFGTGPNTAALRIARNDATIAERVLRCRCA